MKKLFWYLQASVAYLALFSGTTIYANDIGMNETSITRADYIDWRYKVINGILYKRPYNYSKDEWIGDWILA